MKYMIFFQPRCGSTYLASRLNHPEIGLVNGFEIATQAAAKDLSLLTDEESRRFDGEVQRAVLTRFFAENADAVAVGAKVAPYQIRDDIAAYFQFARAACDKLVFIYRENPVQTAISQLWSQERARQGKDANLHKGEERTIRQLHIERALFEYYVINSIVERDTVLSLANACHQKLCLSYEQLFANQENWIGKVKDFLVPGLHGELPDTDIVKSRDKPNHELLANYTEVLQWVADLGFPEDSLSDHAGLDAQ